MIDFDDIDNWAPILSTVLEECVTCHVRNEIATSDLEYMEDALTLLFDLADQNAIINATLTWLQNETLVGYHGSRLEDEEAQSIKENGLVPLRAEQRRDRLIRKLSSHSRWEDVAHRLDPEILRYGSGRCLGERENQVHLTLSRYALENGFNHYLQYGSEFDQSVACELFEEEEANSLLSAVGRPYIVKVFVPGSDALDAAHPYFSINDLLKRKEVPNIVRSFLQSWSCRLMDPAFQSESMLEDIGMVFKSLVPREWIGSVEEVELIVRSS